MLQGRISDFYRIQKRVDKISRPHPQRGLGNGTQGRNHENVKLVKRGNIVQL